MVTTFTKFKTMLLSENKTSYTIKYGDTLSTIAEVLGIDLNVLETRLLNIDLIFPDTALTTIVNEQEEVIGVAEVYNTWWRSSDVATAMTKTTAVDYQTAVEDLTQLLKKQKL